MINVFFDKNVGLLGSWEISTRNIVGAICNFYKSSNSNKTFRQMFIEAAMVCNLDINNLDKELSYSFVLQHPENKIVIPFSKPDLYLVAVYKIYNGLNNVNVKFYNVGEFKCFFNKLNINIKFPTIYKFNDFFTENKSQFLEFSDQIHLFTETLYNNYVKCYIKKQNPLLLFKYLKQYKSHMFNIHQIYMNELREKKQFVTRSIVQNYVNQLHPSLLMYHLNFQLRKNNIDLIAS